MYSVQYIQTVSGREGVGVLSPVRDHILQEFNTLYLTRFRTYKIARPPQPKIWEGRGPQTAKHLPQSPFTGQFFKITTYGIVFYQFKFHGELSKILTIVRQDSGACQGLAAGCRGASAAQGRILPERGGGQISPPGCLHGLSPPSQVPSRSSGNVSLWFIFILDFIRFF
jgi:hypothetical protein